MRLKQEEIKIIKEAVSLLDPYAEIFLFGSRVDLHKKGGDIDLLIISHKLKQKDSLKIIKKIFEGIEEQKIDILIAPDANEPFVQLALNKGIKL